jgi:hypothetical protein
MALFRRESRLPMWLSERNQRFALEKQPAKPVSQESFPKH